MLSKWDHSWITQYCNMKKYESRYVSLCFSWNQDAPRPKPSFHSAIDFHGISHRVDDTKIANRLQCLRTATAKDTFRKKKKSEVMRKLRSKAWLETLWMCPLMYLDLHWMYTGCTLQISGRCNTQTIPDQHLFRVAVLVKLCSVPKINCWLVSWMSFAVPFNILSTRVHLLRFNVILEWFLHPFQHQVFLVVRHAQAFF